MKLQPKHNLYRLDEFLSIEQCGEATDSAHCAPDTDEQWSETMRTRIYTRKLTSMGMTSGGCGVINRL